MSDASRSGSRDTVHDEPHSIAALLNRFNAFYVDNALDQNYADHLHDYFWTDPSASDSDFNDTDTSDLEIESDCTEKQTPRQCLLCGY